MSNINNSRMPTPREKTIKLNALKASQEGTSHANSQRPTLHSSRTLSTFERKGVVVLKYVDTFTRIDVQYKNPHTIAAPILAYNQYIEAVQSLRHNCNFVVLASKFSKEDSSLTLQDLRNLSHDYPKTILSNCTHTCVSKSVNPDELCFTIIQVLKSSISIIERLENELDIITLSESVENFENMHNKNKKIQQEVCSTASKYIKVLEKNSSMFSGLENMIKAQDTLSL